MAEPVSIAGSLALVATGGAYALGLRRVPGAHAVRPWQVTCFTAGLTAAAVTLLGPLHAAADTSVTAHMTQHVVLLGVVTPLLALGAADVVIPRALGGRHRHVPVRWRLAVARHWPAMVVGALVLHAGTAVLWHAPALYDAAVENGVLHGLQHATFLVTGVAFWWLVAAARPRARTAASILAVFANTMASTVLGVWLALSRAPVYRSAPDLGDQQLAGAVMWGAGGLVSTVAAVVLFAAWLASAGHPAAVSHRL